MVRFHIIGNPYIPPSKEYCTDAFTNLSLKFSDMMYTNGHTVYFYGPGYYQNDVKCTKYIDYLTREDLRVLQELSNNFTHPELFTNSHAEIINEQKKIYAKCVQLLPPIVECNYIDVNDIVVNIYICLYSHYFRKKMIHLHCCNMGGYVYAENTVFVSSDYYLAADKRQVKNSEIIYPWLDPEELYPNETHMSKTLLYLARCTKMKGILKFLRISRSLPDYKFIISGNCIAYDNKNQLLTIENGEIINLKLYPNVEYIGIIKGELKRCLLAGVTALLQPTPYREPCGINVLEAMMCGTPVLTPNFGGFVNTVIDGVTGYLCRDSEWITNILKINQIRRSDCRQYACRNFNQNIAYNKYMTFIQKLQAEY